MPPTLRTVAALPQLRLDVLTGADALDRPVRWVAVSELADPTPFLEGGELLLTTGMRASAAEPYVRRLVERGVSGLGFGVGLTHETVPPALVRAAVRHGLPLLAVPRAVPFIAIGKAVSDLLAAEQYDEVARASAAQSRLTRAALRPDGLEAVVARLAAEVRGWALLLGESGRVRCACPAGEAARAPALAPELARLSHQSALSLSSPGGHVAVHPLGAAGRIRGYLAVGAPARWSPATQTVVNAAASLLTLTLERGDDLRAAERRIHAALLDLLLAGSLAHAESVAAALGRPLPEGPVRLVLADAPAGPEIPDDPAGVLALVAPRDGGLAAVVPAAVSGEAITAALAARGTVGRFAAGLSAPVPPAELPAALPQAERALAAARRTGRGAVRHEDLAGHGLLSLLDPVAAEGFAASLLAPLAGSRADLVPSLRAYLSCNGHWDAAAQSLGVHRHTLRYRIRRAAALLDRDLDDPTTRAELWLALTLLG
ncbi:PucR family transcriptional regulator [Bailinhaonella thermotolerans]|uniref:PucR family transcriptional regulator n=1 Tax=Bailinhaonella thermotolerans TaxID=1070861 RepID=A0A3A4A0B1_9ACTN|nr:PucR family transcriptional regulator [Bailinhaonella thermotolerans]RJL21705.1 PucR family transcriptional regulator [Bailinhaonella thermotolerans]